jgi:hypothetical protein
VVVNTLALGTLEFDEIILRHNIILIGQNLSKKGHFVNTRKVEPMVGFEPTTYGLQNRCSNQLSYIGVTSLVGREGFEPPKA